MSESDKVINFPVPTYLTEAEMLARIDELRRQAAEHMAHAEELDEYARKREQKP